MTQYKDRIGQKSGNLEIVDYKDGKFLCRCACGNEEWKSAKKFVERKPTQCTKCNNKKYSKYDNCEGKQFGKWTVIDTVHTQKGIFWQVKCSCGNKAVIAPEMAVRGKSTCCRSCSMKKRYAGHFLKSEVEKAMSTGLWKSEQDFIDWRNKHKKSESDKIMRPYTSWEWSFNNLILGSRKDLEEFYKSHKKTKDGWHIRRLNDPEFIGKKFGKLTVVGFGKDKAGNTTWKCKCDCGSDYEYAAKFIKNGTKTNCGCWNKEFVKHINVDDRLRNIYTGILDRCYDPFCNSFKNYGGRGIKVCDEWFYNYYLFEKWATKNGYDKNAPYGEYTVDRIDVNKDYGPDNCRFLTLSEQAQNKRPYTEILYFAFGKQKTLQEWCSEYGIDAKTAFGKIKRGLTLEELLSKSKKTG